MSTQQMVSIVVPLFNEQELIAELHAQITSSMRSLPRPWEVIYVNDGSTDSTLQRLRAEQSKDGHVVVVDLSRNWGHQAALTAGLSVASGAAIVMMDGDLQDPPTVIPYLVARWESGAQVVVAERRNRSEGRPRRLLSWLFYQTLAVISDVPMPLNSGIFGLIDRQAADAILRLPEANRYLPGIRSWIGYTSATVPYERAERASGDPKQKIKHLFRYASNALFAFSYKPLRLSLFLGMALMLVAVLVTILSIIHRVGRDSSEFRDSTIILAIVFLAGIQLFCVGILGEYVGRIFDEVRRRPLYLIRDVFRVGVDPRSSAGYEEGMTSSGPVVQPNRNGPDHNRPSSSQASPTFHE